MASQVGEFTEAEEQVESDPIMFLHQEDKIMPLSTHGHLAGMPALWTPLVGERGAFFL